MYLKSLKVSNVRSIRNFEIEFDDREFAGWHVVLGDNGAGKSTLIRAIALAFIGPEHALALRQEWSDWLRHGERFGRILAHVDRDSRLDAITGGGAPARRYYIPAGVRFARAAERRAQSVVMGPIGSKLDPSRYIWGDGTGWFSASYGPYRRFAGGNPDLAKLFYSHPKIAPHLSAFGEDVALTECLDWLRDLKFKSLEQRSRESETLELLTRFINGSSLLPHRAQLHDVSSDGVVFVDGFGSRVEINQLSDGYRSILSLTFELIRQLMNAYGRSRIFRANSDGEVLVDVPGVVLIDEVDVHLHPTWQMRLGRWFTRFFPKIQFIVTTHSPLVCQAAVNGTVWRLPSPSSDGTEGRVTGNDLHRLLYGNLVEAFSTNLFGLEETRSKAGLRLLERLAALNAKRSVEKLSDAESRELHALRASLPTAGE